MDPSNSILLSYEMRNIILHPPPTSLTELKKAAYTRFGLDTSSPMVIQTFNQSWGEYIDTTEGQEFIPGCKYRVILQLPSVLYVENKDKVVPVSASELPDTIDVPGTSAENTMLENASLSCETEEINSNEHFESDDDIFVPVSPTIAKSKKGKSSNCFPLPEFSKVVQPILDGDILSEKDHEQISSILKDELITFLNHENLISGGNTGKLRWEYRDLGETLAQKYPKMLWDLPSKRQKKIRRENAPIYTVFIRRLSMRRKMQRLRRKLTKPQNPVAVETEEDNEISSENAVAELKSVTLQAAQNSCNTERIIHLLKKSFKLRCKEDLSELPPFLMATEYLETEVEMRLGSSMNEMSKKIQEALSKISSIYDVDKTIPEMEKLMQPKRATWSAITMGEFSSEAKRPGPSLFFGLQKVLLCGNQVIFLREDYTIEKATILLFGVYYILNLNFPAAYGQFLGLLQNILMRGKSFPKQFSSNHLLMVTKKLL